MLQGTGTYIMRNDQTGLPIDTRQKLLLRAMTIAEFFTQVKYHNKPRIAHSLAHGGPDWWRTRPGSLYPRMMFHRFYMHGSGNGSLPHMMDKTSQ